MRLQISLLSCYRKFLCSATYIQKISYLTILEPELGWPNRYAFHIIPIILSVYISCG